MPGFDRRLVLCLLSVAPLVAGSEPVSGGDWPRQATPGEAGVDSQVLATLRTRAAQANSDALCVLVDGALVSEEYFAREQEPIELMSCTKSVVSLLIGMLIDAGKIESVAAPVTTWYPEFVAAGAAAGSTEAEAATQRAWRTDVTLRHLLTHTSGLAADATTEKIYASPDFVQFALTSPLKTAPGTAFFYNNVACNLLCGIIEKASGQKADEFARTVLFEPLGIEEFDWTRDAAGNPHGMAGLQLHALDFARIGQLVLQRGEWEGRRLVSEAWLDQSMHPAFPALGGAAAVCGYLWWLDGVTAKPVGAPSVRAIRADGFLGNYLVVVPTSRVVAVRQRRFPQDPAEVELPAFGFPDFSALVQRLVAGK